MPSGEIRKIHENCYATIGQVGNVEHMNVSSRQGRPQPLAGRPSDRPRHGHEPGRSPEWVAARANPRAVADAIIR